MSTWLEAFVTALTSGELYRGPFGVVALVAFIARNEVAGVKNGECKGVAGKRMSVGFIEGASRGDAWRTRGDGVGEGDGD